VPCPDCGELQPLEFGQLTWSKLGLPPERAVYECRACFYAIREHQKTAMLARGQWVAEQPERIGKVRGYHLNALYAPVGWMSWGEIATMFVNVHQDPEKFRVFVNTVLGEAWTMRGDAPEWEALYKRREAYALGTVPAGALPGDTADMDKGPWAQVDELLARSYPHASGAVLPVRMLCVDSGYNTQTVYNWARKYPLNRVAAIKGVEGGGVLVGSPRPVEITDRGRKLKRGGRVWPVAGSIAKSELYGFLRLEAPVAGRVLSLPTIRRGALQAAHRRAARRAQNAEGVRSTRVGADPRATEPRARRAGICEGGGLPGRPRSVP